MRILEDAIKTPISMTSFAILNWNMREIGFYEYGIQMPIEVIDKILKWRDEEYKLKGELKMKRPAKPDLAYSPGKTRDYILDLENYCDFIEESIKDLTDQRNA